MVIQTLIQFVSFVAFALMILLFLRALLVRMVHNRGFLYGIFQLTAFATDFVVKPCEKLSRRLAPEGRNLGMFIAFFAVIIAYRIIVYILGFFL